MVLCEDGYLYTGLTRDLTKRVNQHKNSLSRLTKNRGAVRLVYFQPFDTACEAAKREKEIKGWKRDKKEDLTDEFTLKNFL